MTRIYARTIWCGCVAIALAFLLPSVASAQQGLLAESDILADGTRGNGGGPGELLFDQTNACGGGGPASQRFPDFANAVLQSADDFTVPMGETWTIGTVTAQGSFFNPNPNSGPIDNVIVQIWDDAGGLPGNMLCEEVGLNEDIDPNMILTLVGDCKLELTEGTYWLSMMAQMPFAPNGQWAWLPNASANGNEYAFQDPAPLIGGPCMTWGSGSTTCGVAVGTFDLCFSLFAQPLPPPNPLEIPTLGQFGLLAMLLSLIGAGLYRIRRRRR